MYDFQHTVFIIVHSTRISCAFKKKTQSNYGNLAISHYTIIPSTSYVLTLRHKVYTVYYGDSKTILPFVTKCLEKNSKHFQKPA